MFKKALIISFRILFLIGIVVLLGFVGKEQDKVKCQKIDININHAYNNYFVDEEDILNALHEQGDSVIGQPVSSIDIPKMERILRNHPHIKNAEVYIEINGDMHIDIAQRNPILRVINNLNENYFIDEDGRLMPPCEKFSSRIPVANGNIFESYDKFYMYDYADTTGKEKFRQLVILDDLFQIANFLRKDTLWASQIQQIYVDKEIELIPRVGEQEIILGDVSNLDEKFRKLKLFYLEAMPKVGWNAYKTLNLKYKGQVVCTKAQ